MNARRIAIATLLALGTFASAAAAGPVARMQIDRVRVSGRGDHVVVLRAVDAEGRPAEGLDRGLTVRLDGEPAPVRVSSAYERRGKRCMALVVDGEMLQPDAPERGMINDVVRALAAGLDTDDRVLVYSAGRSTRHRDLRAGRLREGSEPLLDLRQGGTPRLMDGIDDALRAVQAAGDAPARVALVLTRGQDEASRRKVASLTVDAFARGVTSVCVVVVGNDFQPALLSQLNGLAVATGGTLGSGAPSAAATTRAALALMDRFEVRFRAAHWPGDVSRHHLVVRLEDRGRALEADHSYTSDEVTEPAWWTSPGVWLVLLAALGLLGLALWFAQPKQVALLVVQGGDDDGVWFEIFELPVSIGAREDNHVLLDDPQVSGVHCLLQREGRDIVLVDQGSITGTFVNGERITRHVLEEDDVIRLGTAVELAYERRG